MKNQCEKNTFLLYYYNCIYKSQENYLEIT